MDAAHPTLVTAEEARKRVADTRKLLTNARELISAAHRLFERNLAIYKDAQATIQRRPDQRAQRRFTMRHSMHDGLSARRPHLLISARIDDGRLPNTASRTALVSGFGGKCGACDGHMPSTELLRAIPIDETFVYLHADCYAIWQAQCRLRAAVRRIS